MSETERVVKLGEALTTLYHADADAHKAVLAELRLADARWTLLQTLVDGLKCIRPDRFMADCGECIICRCKYRAGSLVGYPESAGDHANIPGTPQMRSKAEASRTALLEAINTQTARRFSR